MNRDVDGAVAIGQIFRWGFDGSQDKLALSDRELTSCAGLGGRDAKGTRRQACQTTQGGRVPAPDSE